MLLDLELWCSIPVLSMVPCPGRAGLACHATRALCSFSMRLKVTDRSLQAFKQHIRMRLLTDWHCSLSCMASQCVACPVQPRDREQHSCLAPVQTQSSDPAMKKCMQTPKLQVFFSYILPNIMPAIFPYFCIPF